MIMAGAWSYSGGNGPTHWASMFKKAAGKRQSPINIETNKVRTSDDLKEFTFEGFGDDVTEDDTFMTMCNDGTSVKVSVSGRHYVTGGGLPGKFHVEQFHFHWGSSENNPGSEHALNGQRYAAELHIVTYDCDRFAKFSEALSDPRGLAVLGTFIEVGEETNTGYETPLKEFHKVQQKGETIKLEGLSLRSLLPENINNFYRYDGSLTTPPCAECVIWTLFDEPVQISQTQLDQFLSLKSSGEEGQENLLVNNYRPVQPMAGRVVTASFVPAKTHDETEEHDRSCAVL